MMFFSLFVLGLLVTGLALGALIEMGVLTMTGAPLATVWVVASLVFAALFREAGDAGGDALYEGNTPKAGGFAVLMVGVVVAAIIGIPWLMSFN